MSVVKKLSRKLKNFSVQINDWTLSEEGVTVLWGTSGSGKSTILNALLGLDAEADVCWEWGGTDVSQWPPDQRHFGVVFQNLGLFPHLTARENILFPINKQKHTLWEEDFAWLVKSLQLQGCLDLKSTLLSGGEKQRVALARSVIYRPRMLFLDEPFSSLDEALKSQAREAVKKVVEYLQCPVLLVTHDRRDVEALGQTVCQIQQGQIVYEGPELP